MEHGVVKAHEQVVIWVERVARAVGNRDNEDWEVAGHVFSVRLVGFWVPCWPPGGFPCSP